MSVHHSITRHITSDNPRGEDPAAIIDEVIPGFSGKTYDVVVDREAAIRRAIELARPGDIVLLAGKGHEPYQDMGSLRLPFSDVEQAGAALALRRSKQEETA